METSNELTYSYPRVLLICLTATIGSFLYGYNMTVFNSSMGFISELLDWGDSQTFFKSLASGLTCFGGILGALSSGSLINAYGTLKTFCIADIVGIIASLITVVPNTSMFCIGRFGSGFTAGVLSSVTPAYVNNMAPREIVGSMGSLYEIQFNLGLIFAYAFGLVLPEHIDEDNGMESFWVFLYIFYGIVCAIQLLVFSKILNYETVFWLRRQGKELEAQRTLTFLYPSCAPIEPLISLNNECNSETLIIENLEEKAQNEMTEDVSYKVLLCNSRYSKMMRLGIILSIFQVMCGFDNLIQFSTSIFETYGLDSHVSRLATVFIGITCAGSALAVLCISDKLGRKTLLIVGSGGMAIGMIGSGYFSDDGKSYIYTILSLLTFTIFCFEISYGCAYIMYMGEVLNPKALSFATAINWWCKLTYDFMFIYQLEILGAQFTFYMYGIICVLSLFYISFDMFESLGLSREDINKKIFRK